MTWCTDSTNDVVERLPPPSSSPKAKGKDHHTGVAINVTADSSKLENWTIRSCPSCGHQIKCLEQQAKRINELPGLPAGVRFDPTDQELLQHLEAKVKPEYHHRLHPLIDEFIPTIDGENGICYTHPEKLPGVSKDGLVRHFFHRPSKAYTTGTRKRRKVHTDEEGCETRWHKTGKTRPVTVHGKVTVKGYKKILVLYTNYGKQKKPEKTSWVMHQYHLGLDEEEREGELVVSKVFYQTQPRQCGGGGGSRSGGGSIISMKMKGIGSGTGAGRMGSAVGTHHHHHHNMMGVDHHQNDVVGHPPPVTSSLISFEPRSHGSGGGDHGSGSGGGGGRSSPPAALFPFCCP